VKELRRIGIRTILDLSALSEEEVAALPLDTSVTTTVLARARESVTGNQELHRLAEVGQLLGMFWGRKESQEAAVIGALPPAP
jgi:hypothetical protein